MLSSSERRLSMIPSIFLGIEGRLFNYALLAVPNHCVDHRYNVPSPSRAKQCALLLGRSIAGRCELDLFSSVYLAFRFAGAFLIGAALRPRPLAFASADRAAA